jgi:hypothetical protein
MLCHCNRIRRQLGRNHVLDTDDEGSQPLRTTDARDAHSEKTRVTSGKRARRGFGSDAGRGAS